MSDLFENQILSVSEITGEIKQILEYEFDAVQVIGEISNFKAHFSGHWYFSLKDAGAQINCTMWKGFNNLVYFTPQDGMKIIVRGKITVYPPRGAFQIDVRSMTPAGVGELQMAYEKLKEKLSAEGLFDPGHKKNIPVYPEKIGIATAIDGAALKDMISVAERRYPLVQLIVGGCRVQGDGAAREIAERIREFNEFDEVDLIIIGRGGGSLEDLWAFNEEVVARAVFESKIPVISAVGHEIDYTISDFTADLRAPTPTAAMELATPDINDILGYINEFSYNLTNNISSKISMRSQTLDGIVNSYAFRLPADKIKNSQQILDHLLFRFENSINVQLKRFSNKLDLLNNSIKANDVQSILKKGYTIIRQNEQVVGRAKNLAAEKPFKIKFYDKDVEVNK